jgi:hypothetical protein
MHLIGFSHHYDKICGQTYGTLLSVRVLSEEEMRKFLEPRFNSPTFEMDTSYQDEYGRWYGYEIQPDERLQLVFIGEHQIPFTTYRKIPKNYTPLRKSRTYRKSLPYSELIGSLFAFKFKGEKLPSDLESSIDSSSVKIFN